MFRAYESEVSLGENVQIKVGRNFAFAIDTKTFSLVFENGEWKITDIDPAPRWRGIGVRPLR